MAETKQYVLGRGKLFFSRFIPGTQTPEGFLYMGNTPDFSLTLETEDLPHFNADEGVREEDDSVSLEVTRTGSLVTDNITPQNVALFFMGDSSVLTQAAVPLTGEVLDAPAAGYSYPLGVSLTNPSGHMGISEAGFTVMTQAGAVAATGTLTVGAGDAAAADTVTIAGRTYTFRSTIVGSVADDVLIGGSVTETAANLVAAITGGAGAGVTYHADTLPHPQVTASNVAGVVTITALPLGLAGNAFALAATGANLTASGATLTGGANGTLLQPVVDFDMDFDAGLLTFTNTTSLVDGSADIIVNYAVAGSSRTVVLSGNNSVEGAVRFVTKNAKGPDSVLYMPWVKVMPNGDYNLKGDEWQQIPLSLKILKPENQPAFRRDGKPAYQ